MKAIRGNSPNLVAFSNLIFKVSKFSEPHQFNGYGSLNLLRIRLFSSVDAHNRNEEGIKNGRNDSDDSKFSGGNQGFNPGDYSDVVVDGSKFSGGNQGFNSGDDSDVVDDDSEFENGDYGPSVREVLNCPLPDENRGGKAETRSNEVNSTTPPEKEKMDVPPDADDIFNEMKKSGLIPNAVAMIDGLCNDGLIHEAMTIFGKMREKGTMPEVIVYTSVVEGFCRAQKIDDAVRVFKKMKDNGIVPNAFSYAVLIKGLCKATRLEEATYLCVEMVEAGHSPNLPLFTGLVEELCKEKGLEDAKMFILTLRQKGFLLDEKAVRVYYDKTGPTSSMVWEAIFGPKKTYRR